MNKNKAVLLINNDGGVSDYLREKLILKGECEVLTALTASSGIEEFKKNNFAIAVINFNLPDMSVQDLVKNFKHTNSDTVIILLVDQVDDIIIKQIGELGVYDHLTMPANIEKFLLLVKKGIDLYDILISQRKILLTLREQNQSLQKQNTQLAQRIEESARNLAKLYEDLRSTYMRTVKVLAHAIDARDHYTHSHSENVARYAVMIAEEMNLSVEQTEKIRDACELHDLGKIGVEDSILTKQMPLTEEEWLKIKQHPLIGVQILEPLAFLGDIISFVKQHHEHFNGSGYPLGLQGEGILVGARIIHVADAYEAMRSSRSYREIPLSKEEAIEEIKVNTGTQFDPEVVNAFLKIIDELP